MADGWIKFRKKLCRDPRALIVSRKCHTSVTTVIGALVTLWSLADDYAEASGALPGYTTKDVDRLVNVPGFCEALPPDWIQVEGESIHLPNYQEHNGDTGKSRAEAARRKMRSRAGHELVTKESQEKRDQRREEKSRGEKKKPPLPPFPPELDVEEFRELWARWERHRRETHKPLKPTSTAAKLRELAGWGLPRALAAVRFSLANGYQGIFEAKEGQGGNGRAAQPTLQERVAAAFQRRKGQA